MRPDNLHLCNFNHSIWWGQIQVGVYAWHINGENFHTLSRTCLIQLTHRSVGAVTHIPFRSISYCLLHSLQSHNYRLVLSTWKAHHIPMRTLSPTQWLIHDLWFCHSHSVTGLGLETTTSTSFLASLNDLSVSLFFTTSITQSHYQYVWINLIHNDMIYSVIILNLINQCHRFNVNCDDQLIMINLKIIK